MSSPLCLPIRTPPCRAFSTPAALSTAPVRPPLNRLWAPAPATAPESRTRSCGHPRASHHPASAHTRCSHLFPLFLRSHALCAPLPHTVGLPLVRPVPTRLCSRRLGLPSPTTPSHAALSCSAACSSLFQHALCCAALASRQRPACAARATDQPPAHHNRPCLTHTTPV